MPALSSTTGPLARLQNEASARRADVERVAHPDLVAQVRPGRPVRLDLHADAIAPVEGAPESE